MDDQNNTSQTNPSNNGDYKKPPKRKFRERVRHPRSRFLFIWVLGFLVIALNLLTDPDTGLIRQLPFGAGTVATLIILTRGAIYASLLHFTRKGLMDYFDMEEAWHRCKSNPVAVGLFVIGAGMYTVGMAIVIYAATTGAIPVSLG